MVLNKGHILVIQGSNTSQSNMADAFISHAPEDYKLAEALDLYLSKRGKIILRNERSIPSTPPYPFQVEKRIISTNALIHIISPESAASSLCLHELKIAIDNGKRLIPIYARDVNPEKVHELLRDLDWIDFRVSVDFKKSARSVLFALNANSVQANYHTWLQMRAIDWESRGRKRTAVLRGKELEKAEKWFSLGEETVPGVTQLQREFFLASRREVQVRHRRITVGLMVALVIVSIMLGITTLSQFLFAQERELARMTAETVAREHLDIANARKLAAQARGMIQNDPILALMIAIEAQKIVETDEALQVIAELAYFYPPQGKVLNAHQAGVNTVAWSPDGSRFASGSDDHKIIIWDALTLGN